MVIPPFSLTPPSWTTLWSGTRKVMEDALLLAMDQTVRLAVTGLNQSGKTVFITTLIHQLLQGHRSKRLPLFGVVETGRFQGAKVIEQPNLDISTFGYDRFMLALNGSPPAWPQATDGLSEIRLAIRYRPKKVVQKYLQPLATLYLDIIDYPGEWLLDLPMLDLSFAAWSAETLVLCEQEPRLTLAREWRHALASINPSAPADEEVIRQVSKLFTRFLRRCKEPDVGLHFLQPGRFLIPGDLLDTPLLAFCPLPTPAKGTYPSGSLYATMEQRYLLYRDRVVRSFYKKHFSRFDRQIVLVDPMRALNKGFGSFSDMEKTLQSILSSFNYGPAGLLRRLFKPRIDKLLFAASKVDHVAANQHHNLERLLEHLVAIPTNNALFHGVQVKAMTLASVRCTQTVVQEHDGRRLSFVQGIPKGRSEEILLFPGEIPETIPDPADWDAERFRFLEFEPRGTGNSRDGTLPHIRVDQALEFLLGDKLC
ncbi:MAG: YcjX family protein [Magnetococcales bacterium]|nr:YcjX family protein [Magnetococcales bacterium]